MLRALVLAVGLSLVAATGAYACACIARSPGQKLREADAAFVGKVESFRDEGETRIYTVAVERVYKGSVGARAEILGGNPDDNVVTDCDEAFAVGEEAGGYFKGPPEQWFVGTCNRAGREQLDRAAAEIRTAGEASPRPVFLARGPFGDSPFAVTDGTGRALAYAPPEPAGGLLRVLSACPGGDHLIDGLAIRRISDLLQVGTLGAGGPAPGQLRCVRADGRAAVGFTPSRLGSRGELVRLTPGRTRTLARGRWGIAALGTRRSALAAVNPGGTLVVVDNSSGRRRVVRRENRNCVDLELSPDQTRVAETVSRRRGERVTQAFVHRLSRRTSLRRRIDGYDLVWYAPNLIASVGSDNRARVYDARLKPVSKRFTARDGGTFGASGDLWWIRDGRLHRRGAGGFPVKLDLPVRGPLLPIPARSG